MSPVNLMLAAWLFGLVVGAVLLAMLLQLGD